MRCPECDHRQKRKAGMICGQCSYTYVFESKSNDANTLNDYQLRRLVARLSQEGHYFFTRTQLVIAISI